jgi:hypothetical protein
LIDLTLHRATACVKRHEDESFFISVATELVEFTCTINQGEVANPRWCSAYCLGREQSAGN